MDDRDLAAVLLDVAGVQSTPAALETALGTNGNLVFSTDHGERFVARRYTWDGQDAYAPASRMRREAWIFRTLGRPAVLAELEDPPTLLLEFVPGEPLGEIASRGEATGRQWRTAGEEFARLHTLPVSAARDAGVEIDDDDPARDLADAAAAFEALASSRPDVDLIAAWELHEAAESAPPRSSVIHRDAHLWNVLAGDTSVLIDAEKAMGGDPDFDIAYMEAMLFRGGVGELPDAFFEGYGARPAGVWAELHRANMAAFVLDLTARGGRWVAAGVEPAERRLGVR